MLPRHLQLSTSHITPETSQLRMFAYLVLTNSTTKTELNNDGHHLSEKVIKCNLLVPAVVEKTENG